MPIIDESKSVTHYFLICDLCKEALTHAHASESDAIADAKAKGAIVMYSETTKENHVFCKGCFSELKTAIAKLSTS